MTIVDLIGLAQGETQNALAVNEYNLATLTGYLLIAYFIGANLTFFQVSFVNFLIRTNAARQLLLPSKRSSAGAVFVSLKGPSSPNIATSGLCLLACQ